MKGELHPDKSDFFSLPQTYKLKLYLENITCYLVIFPGSSQTNESASHVINQINSSLGVGNNEVFN